MKKFTTEDVKWFLNNVIIPKWIRDGKIKPQRAVSYTLTMYKEGKRRTCDYIINLNSIMAPVNNFGKDLVLIINNNTFQCNEYDFSVQWKEFINSKENIQTI